MKRNKHIKVAFDCSTEYQFYWSVHVRINKLRIIEEPNCVLLRDRHCVRSCIVTNPVTTVPSEFVVHDGRVSATQHDAVKSILHCTVLRPVLQFLRQPTS